MSWEGYYNLRLRVKGRKGERKKIKCRKKVWVKRTWKKQVEEENVKVGLRREDAPCRSKWSVGINQITAGSR